MARWAVFAGVTAFTLGSLLILAFVSRPSTSDDEVPATDSPPRRSLSAGTLLANVALTQGVLFVVVAAGAWYARIPTNVLGVVPNAIDPATLAVGVALGIALSVANQVGSRGARAVGIEVPDGFRAALTPDTAVGWAVLLGGVLPVVAVCEEFLFRAAVIGTLSGGFSVAPWLAVVVSAVAFALGHGAQGALGVVVTGSFGAVLAVAFVVTGSLLVVVVAHYLVNALEFAVQGGTGGW